MFRISMNESAVLRVIANTGPADRGAVVLRLRNRLRGSGQEIADALVGGANATPEAKRAAAEFEAAATANPGR